MLITPIDEARVGMTLAMPVAYADKSDQHLLRQGFVLEQYTLDKMINLGITTLFVHYPGTDDFDKHLARAMRGPTCSGQRR